MNFLAKTGLREKSPASKTRLFILVFLGVLSCISFYTTYDGLIRFSYGSLEKTPTAFVIVLFMFVTVLQGMLLFSLFELLRSRFYIKPLWMLVYVATMGVSVFFSYSFYYNLFRADSYAFDNFSVQLKRVKQSAQDYQLAFSQVRNDTEGLAEYSRDKAEEERAKGGTCGYASAPKAGPRSRYRDKEEVVFTGLSSDISDLNDKVKEDLVTLENLVRNYHKEKQPTETIQTQMNTVVQRLNSYKGSGKLSNLRTTLRNHMYERRLTEGLDEEGLPITCPDNNINYRGTSIIKQVEKLPAVAEVELFDPESDHEVLSRALTVFMQIPKAILPESWQQQLLPQKAVEQAEATKITNLDFSPLILGGLVDLFILVVGLADGMERRHTRWNAHPFKGRYISSRDIPDFGEIASDPYFLETLRYNLKRNRLRQQSLVIPSTPERLKDAQHGILELVEAMESFGILGHPRRMDVCWEELPVDMQHSLISIDKLAPHRLYRIYHLPRRVWKELQTAYYTHHLNAQAPDPENS